MKTDFFECACHSPDHLLIFHFDPEEGDLYIDVHLGAKPWRRRFWIALRYLFGHRSNYGCFNCWQLESEDADRMISILQQKKTFDEKKKLESEQASAKVWTSVR
jgi:hypothetical protein